MAAIAGVCVLIAARTLPEPEPRPEAERAAAPEAVAPREPSSPEPGPPLDEVLAAAAGATTEKPEPRGPGYRVNAPDPSFALDDALQEISGLSLAKDGQSLWAVDDERPTLFAISTEDGRVVQQLELGKRGDYESVEEIGTLVWVARSDGVVLVVDPTGEKPTEKLSLLTDLGLACDLEGIAYEPKKQRLLLSCKNEGSKTRRSNKAFEIYEMNLQTREVAKEPAFVLTEAAIDTFLTDHADVPGLKRRKGKNFAPSGLAVHPKTGELYILSTRGKMLVVLASDGKLVHIDPLDDQVHLQPEGITFGADGTLYISNEAHGSHPARLHVFRVTAEPAAEARR